MEEIKIIPKPDKVSWDDIHQLLLAAHKRNIEKGVVLNYAQMPGEAIEKKLGPEGCCWVAMDGDKLVGTTSVTYFQGRSWWNKGKIVAHGCFTGILKEYQGIGILEELYEKKYEHIRNSGVDMIEGDTAENNRVAIKVFKKEGHKFVSYFASPSASDHYSIRIVKWLNNCPYSDSYINRRFQIAKILTKMQYKRGRVERSYIISLFCRVVNKILKYK